tara:strand:- start:3081 stop:3305 length:225 start_codon:yes stop_codon:yes gene_type:complete
MSNLNDIPSVGSSVYRIPHKPHQHQVLINQSLLKRIDADIKEMKDDCREIKSMLKYIKEYTEKKEEVESARWFR